MTENELKQIISDASNEVVDSLTNDEINKAFTLNKLQNATPNELLAGAAVFAIKVNQQVLFKVLSKVLLKD